MVLNHLFSDQNLTQCLLILHKHADLMLQTCGRYSSMEISPSMSITVSIIALLQLSKGQSRDCIRIHRGMLLDTSEDF